MTSLKQWITPPKQRGEVISSLFLNYHFTFVCSLFFLLLFYIRWMLLLNWMPLIQGKALEKGEDKCLRLTIDEFKWTIDLVCLSFKFAFKIRKMSSRKTMILHYKLTRLSIVATKLYWKVVSLQKIYKKNFNWVCVHFLSFFFSFFVYQGPSARFFFC